MNGWQHMKELAATLAAATWPDSPSEKVFGAVRATAGEPGIALRNLPYPFVLLTMDGSENDDENPGLVTYQIGAVIVAHAEGQEVGQAALMGSNRSGGAGSSKGRGVLELDEEFNRAAGRLTGADGAPAVVYESGAAQAEEIAAGRMVVARRHALRVLGTAARYYGPCLYLAATAPGGGNAVLTWTLPPGRWDYLKPVVRWAAGSTAPATATDGTGVAGLVAASVGATVATGAGTFSFAVFASYDETGSGTAGRYSAQELSTTVTVVVT